MNDYLQQQCDEMNAALRTSNRAQIESRIQLEHRTMHRYKIVYEACAVLLILPFALFELFILAKLSTFPFTPLFVLACRAVAFAFTWLIGGIVGVVISCYWDTYSLIEDRIHNLQLECEANSDDQITRTASRKTLEYFSKDGVWGVAP